MRHLRKTLPLIGALLLFTLAAPTLSAANFTFTGNFSRDDSLLLLNFIGTTPGTVQIVTTSYTTGGFSPVLSLFDQQQNNLLIGRDNGVDHPNGEANLTQMLGAGSYFVVLSQFDNLAAGPTLQNGFLRTGDGTFTREFGPPGATGPFLDIDGQQRTSNFAVTLNNVSNATVAPEPVTSTLLLAGLGALCSVIRMRRRS